MHRNRAKLIVAALCLIGALVATLFNVGVLGTAGGRDRSAPATRSTDGSSTPPGVLPVEDL